VFAFDLRIYLTCCPRTGLMHVSEVPTFGQAVGGADGNFHVRGMQGSDNCCVPRTQRGEGLHFSCEMRSAFHMVCASSLDCCVASEGDFNDPVGTGGST